MAKINRRMLCDATFRKGAFKRLTDRQQLCYCKLCVYADDEGAIEDYEGLMSKFHFELDELKALIENDNFFILLEDNNGDEFLVVENFYEANNNLGSSDNKNFKKSVYHNIIERELEITRLKAGGDGHYRRKRKKPIDTDAQQNIENASNGKQETNNNNNGFNSEGQETENDCNDNLLSNKDVEAVIEACPSEYVDDDGKVAVALYNCLNEQSKGLNINSVREAVRKYYETIHIREISEKETLSLSEFLSNSTLVLSEFLRKTPSESV